MKYILSFFILTIAISYSFAGGCGDGTGGTQQFPAGPNTAPPSCLNSQPAGNTCATATPICDLNGYCGSTAATYTADNLDWCELTETFCGLTIENNSFLTFIPSQSTISFDIWLTSSSMGYGIQLMIFSSTEPCAGTVTNHACWNIGSVPSGSTTISASGLTPGNTYYIMVDGNAGDVVEYVIAANTGISLGLEIQASSTTICAGESVDLIANGGNGTYNWNASPDLSTLNGANTTATPSGPGSFTYTVNSQSGNALCPAEVSESVIITVQDCGGCVVNATNSGNVCSGGNVNLFATTISGATYTWTGPNGFNSNDQNPTNIPIPTSPGSYTYTVTVNDNGYECQSSTTIIVNSQPTLTAQNNYQVCEGECATLSVSGADYYSWSPANLFTDPTNPNPTVCPTQTTTYTVTGYQAGANSVVNGDFSDGASGFTSDYTLSSDTQPESTYFVATDASSTHPSFVGVDHTTGAENFMIVNGAGTPNSSVWCQTVQVQQNTDYVFSTWVSTLAVGSPAILQFSINGNVLGTPFNAPANTGEWDEFYSTWNSGTSTSATICIVNQNTNVGGNDFGLDDIYFAALCTSTENVTVTVNALPPVNAGNDVSVCTGQSVTLNGTGATSYTWDNGVTNGQAFTPTATATYTVTGTDANSCQNTDQVIVTVNPLPTVNAGSDVTVCANDEVTLTASGATTYSWNNGVTNGTPFNPTTTTTYIVVGTDANTCQNTDQVLVTVNALPPVNAGADQAICIGESVTLTATGANSYAWTNNVVNGTAFSPTSTATYTVTGTGSNGCVNSDEVTVTVNPLPTINAGADQTICAGMNVTLNATGGATYVWSDGSNNGQSISPGTTTTLTVTGTTAAGCSSTDEITITVLPVPNASFTADAITGYPVHTVTFTNTSTNATNYTWDFGNGTIIPATTTASQTQAYTDTAVYTVVLFASNGICSDSTSIQIFVLPFPDAIIEVPNVFTPNGDGLNDNWWVKAEFASEMSVQIFNRWGNLMKEISGLYDPLNNNTYWNGQVDGTDATDGVYFYKFVVKDFNDKEYTGHGNITVIRIK